MAHARRIGRAPSPVTLQQRFPAESHALCILTTIERGLSMSYEAKLAQMGYTIEPVELNTGRFMQAVRTGNLIYTSGQVSSWGDEKVIGKLGQDLTVEQGYAAARLCALGCLRAVKSLTGSLDNVVRGQGAGDGQCRAGLHRHARRDAWRQRSLPGSLRRGRPPRPQRRGHADSVDFAVEVEAIFSALTQRGNLRASRSTDRAFPPMRKALCRYPGS